LGAILAVPLTLFFQSLLIRTDPRAGWLNVFLESEGRDATLPDAALPDAGGRVGPSATGAAQVSGAGVGLSSTGAAQETSERTADDPEHSPANAGRSADTVAPRRTGSTTRRAPDPGAESRAPVTSAGDSGAAGTSDDDNPSDGAGTRQHP
jgi:hypothetical protein